MDQLSQWLENIGIESLNAMQQEAVNVVNTTADVVLLAPTGSGKTLAFLLPLAARLDGAANGVQALLVVPTRELALQIEQVWKALKTGFKVTCCYGGHDFATEARSLSEAPALIIGTPGRILDHIHRRTVDLSTVTSLVLDEYDKSLELGYQEEMEGLVNALTVLEHRVLVSATILKSYPRFMEVRRPLVLNYLREHLTTSTVASYQIQTADRAASLQALVRLLRQLQGEQAVVFCNLRDSVEELTQELRRVGLQASGFHGKLEQMEREKELIKFRNGSVAVLVATDLAARGLDIPDVKHVIHFELPVRKDEFIHRNGRTGRMNADGNIYLFLQADQPSPYFLPDLRLDSFKWTEVVTPANTDANKVTVYISAGKRQKIGKGDIMGYFCQKGEIPADAIGLIEIKDNASFVAVTSALVPDLLDKLDGHKLKGKKVKVAIAS